MPTGTTSADEPFVPPPGWSARPSPFSRARLGCEKATAATPIPKPRASAQALPKRLTLGSEPRRTVYTIRVCSHTDDGGVESRFARARARGTFRGEIVRARFDIEERANRRVDIHQSAAQRWCGPMDSVHANPGGGWGHRQRVRHGLARRSSTRSISARGRDDRRFQLCAAAR